MAPERPAAHRFPLRVYWEDTDAAGIVYYANYLRFLERARSELVRGAGIDQPALLRGEGLCFQVRRCEIDYLAPARLDDRLEVCSAVLALRGASVEIGQAVWRGETALARARLKIACVDRGGRPRRLPPAVSRALRAYSDGIGES